ncbi:MAG: 5-(carboxyamino)imidazole ribonucleotide synthase, partial [Thermoplasmatota archaeon]
MTRTLGILGGGQLGRMIANDARRLGYKVAVMDSSPDCPAYGAADAFVEGAWDDLEAMQRLAKISDVLTVENEHLPADMLAQVEASTPLFPHSGVLRTIQDRLNQRRFLADHEIPQPAWAAVATAQEAQSAAKEIGVPGILKSRFGGYDGKGQVRIQEGDDPASKQAELGVPGIWEAFVHFDREISILVTRDQAGNMVTYPLAENEHRGGILHITQAPADATDDVARQAATIARQVAEGLGHVGTLCVELFDVQGQLLVNEIAPRVHNSGHHTLGACITSQFENHARAVLGLPLGDPTQHTPAAMLNILGDAWNAGVPNWNPILSEPRTNLHLYGKAEARPGRKMG